jgi:LysM repeat protein
MFRIIITLLICCCISLTANAQEISLKKSHPERHVVVKGDTLWDISSKFLQDPWRWKEVWDLNRTDIKNPHLIYPGDVIVFDNSNGHPSLRLLRKAALGESGYGSEYTSGSNNTVIMNPEVIIEPLAKEPISTIALSSVAPFLTQPLIIEKNGLKGAPRIIAGQDERVILGQSTNVYIRGITNTANLDWHLYRQGKKLIDPQTKTDLGYEAIYLGDAKIIKHGDPATAQITKAKEEIFAKDRLMPINAQYDANFMPHAPAHAIDGRIINIYSGVAEAGTGSIVSINRGMDNGIEVGHVLAIKHLGRIIKDTEADIDSDYSLIESIKNIFENDDNIKQKRPSNMIKLPDERAGLLMIFRTFKNVSYGIVMQTQRSISQLDVVANP